MQAIEALGPAVMIALLVAVGLLPILTAFWAYDDAERRGKSGCLVALLVLFVSWPVGLILWLVFRPEPRC